MAVITQMAYTSSSTEIAFMQGFIDLICGLDNDITCEDVNGNETTAAAQFADLTSASRASFYFNFNNAVKIEFRRGTNNNSAAKNYNVYVNNVSVVGLNFASGTASPTTSTNRSWFVGYAKGNDTLCLWLGSYNISALSNTNLSVLRIKTSNNNYLGYINSSAIMTSTLYSTSASVTFANVLPYACQSGYIDYISNAKFVSGGTKQFETSDFLSCSTVSLFSNIALPNGKNYLAVGTNTLLEVTATS